MTRMRSDNSANRTGKQLSSAATKTVTSEKRKLLEHSSLVTGIGANSLWYQQMLSTALFSMTSLHVAVQRLARTD